jgi:hypothetical protein
MHTFAISITSAFVKKRGWVALATKPVIDGVHLDTWGPHRHEDPSSG